MCQPNMKAFARLVVVGLAENALGENSEPSRMSKYRWEKNGEYSYS